MATQWGVVPTGYYRPRFPEIRAEFEARFKSRLGADRNTNHGTVDGGMVDFVSESAALILEADERNYNAQFFDSSEGTALDDWMAGRGFVRREARSTRVTLTPVGAMGVTVAAGSVLRIQESGELFNVEADAEIGVGDLVAVAQNTGPISASVGVTWEVVTPIINWDGVTHTEDPLLGNDLETDAELKKRYRQAIEGGSIKAALLKVDGVTSVRIFENDTDVPDTIYSATHWVEALVVGGADQDIIDVLWSTKGKGIGTQGDSSGTELLSGEGNTVRYSRGSEVEATLVVAITGGEGFPAGVEAQIEAEIADWGNEAHSHGDDIAAAQVVGEIARRYSGRFSATVTMDIGGSPSTTILAIADRSVAVFDAARITVTIS